MVEEVKRIRTKKGDAMAFVNLQDDTGPASVTLFPEEYAKLRAEPKKLRFVKDARGAGNQGSEEIDGRYRDKKLRSNRPVIPKLLQHASKVSTTRAGASHHRCGHNARAVPILL